MSFPGYPEYKDSGVEWLGKVPAHWRIVQLRHLADCLDGLRIPLNAQQRSGRQGSVPYWGANGVVDYVDDFLIDDKVVLLGEDGAPFFDKTKSVAFVALGKIWPNNHIHVLRPKKSVSAGFLSACLNATNYIAHIDGSTRDKLTQSSMNQIAVPTPPVEEQQAITEFLERETTKIDALVEEQQRLIELLKEKRQAVISQAVTKGLNPNVPMKDSGVEWLGAVPKHWRATRLKAMYLQVKRQGHAEKEVLSVYREFGVISKDSRTDNFNKTPEDVSSYQLVEPGDLVVNKMKAWQGSLGVSTLTGITSPDYVVFSPQHRECHEYLHLLLRSSAVVSTYLAISNGIRLAQWRLEPESFLSLYVFVPPLGEQRAIADFLNSQMLKWDSLVAEAESGIELLNERRTALISAAVTGKIDVRRSS